MPAQTCATCSKPSTDSPLRSCTRCKTTQYCSTTCQSSDWPSHKEHCKRQNYLLHFHLCPEWISDPPVTRTLSVPAVTTFETLHQALQIAFDWAHSHAHDFAVCDPSYDASANDGLVDHVQATIHYDRGDHACNPREFLLRILQDPQRREEWEELMRRDNRVGYIDRMHEYRRRHPRTVEKFEHKYKVFQFLEDAAYSDKVIEYMYDFGDGWSHRMTVTGRVPATENITCVDGTGHGVGEDVNRDGWRELKAAYRASNPSSEQREKMEWYEKQCNNGDSHGLGGGREFVFDMDVVNRKLSLDDL